MNVILPPDLQQFVTDQVASGEFHNPGEVICEGLGLLRERERQLADLRARLQEAADQLDRGEGIPHADVFAELRERHRLLTNPAVQVRDRA